MSKFHSTVSRRAFMKGLGLAGAGLGAAAVATPVFRDLDDVISSPQAGLKRPWWIKEVDEPTVEVDWSQVKREDQTDLFGVLCPASSHPDAVYTQQNERSLIETYIKNRYPNWKGDTLRDLALSDASQVGAFNGQHYLSWLGPDLGGPVGMTTSSTSFVPYRPSGVTSVPWQGTPEDNLRMVRAAVRFLGGTNVFVVELTEQNRKLVFSKGGNVMSICPSPPFKDYVFEDVDEAYETNTKWVIPNKCRWVIVWTVAQPTETTLRAPSRLGSASWAISYTLMNRVVDPAIQRFVKGLGYHGLSGGSGAIGPSGAFGVISGAGEHGRLSNTIVSPEHGATLRFVNRIITDLPLAPTKPIDFGANRFCLTCKICADSCPFGALPTGEPTWETIPGTMHGFKGYRTNYLKCPWCGACMAVCPFTSTAHSWIHELVRGTISTTPVFNSFFRNMEKTFDYGFKEPESWWELEDEPMFGVAKALL